MGIPMISCQCAVCTSENFKDRRLRTSVWLEIGELSLVIDSGIDFRQQALREKIRRVDAVLFTHHHVDHVFGLDDLRPFNFLGGHTVDIFAGEKTLENLNRIFPYVFSDNCYQSDIPRVRTHLIDHNPFCIKKTRIVPITLYHGELPVFGFRIGNFAYCTDVSHIPTESYSLLQDLDVLVLGALRHHPHPNHFTFEEAVHQARRIGAGRTYLVHMSHELSHNEMMSQLPPEIQPAYDGLKIDLHTD
jgi:phosphoribosyl 1,2-cyclic phosphate phosphodiesterase